MKKEQDENNSRLINVNTPLRNSKKRHLSDVFSNAVPSISQRSSVLRRMNDSNLMANDQDVSDIEFLAAANLECGDTSRVIRSKKVKDQISVAYLESKTPKKDYKDRIVLAKIKSVKPILQSKLSKSSHYSLDNTI